MEAQRHALHDLYARKHPTRAIRHLPRLRGDTENGRRRRRDRQNERDDRRHHRHNNPIARSNETRHHNHRGRKHRTMPNRKLIVIERLERPADDRTHSLSIYDMERAPRPSEWPLRASKLCSLADAELTLQNAQTQFDCTVARYEA